jgi:hypothetical protein
MLPVTREDFERAFGIRGCLKLSVVGNERVASFTEEVVIVQILISLTTILRVTELFGTT